MLEGVNHVAIAVRSIDDTLPFWRDCLGFDLQAVEVVSDQRVRVAVLVKGGHRIELLEADGNDSPLTRFLQRHGPGLHHLCLEVSDMDGMLAQLHAEGVRLIDEKARSGAEGRRIAFLHPEASGGVLLELSEKPEDT